MKLFIQEPDGSYAPASRTIIMDQARVLARARFKRGTKIQNSKDAEDCIADMYLNIHDKEVFSVLYLDAKHKVIAWEEVSHGSISESYIYPRTIVTQALKHCAAAVIFSHNHPSGDVQPSYSDIDLTEKLKDILQVISVRVLDHFIIGDGVYSFADNGQL